MRIILSLLLLVLAGIALIALPQPLFGIPKNDTVGILRIWGSSLKLFAIPFTLLLLGFTKNPLVQLGNLIWGFWLLITTVIFFFRVQEHAPAITQNGRLFLASVLIVSLALFVFTATQFLPKHLKITQTENPPVNPS